ncbi:hypothetical protein BJX62DRAFT_214262 [Aspergillus germanicus]
MPIAAGWFHSYLVLYRKLSNDEPLGYPILYGGGRERGKRSLPSPYSGVLRTPPAANLSLHDWNRDMLACQALSGVQQSNDAAFQERLPDSGFQSREIMTMTKSNRTVTPNLVNLTAGCTTLPLSYGNATSTASLLFSLSPTKFPGKCTE